MSEDVVNKRYIHMKTHTPPHSRKVQQYFILILTSYRLWKGKGGSLTERDDLFFTNITILLSAHSIQEIYMYVTSEIKIAFKIFHKLQVNKYSTFRKSIITMSNHGKGDSLVHQDYHHHVVSLAGP